MLRLELVATFDKEWKSGDRAKAKEMAKEFVDANRASLAPQLEPYTREELVELVGAYRRAGREADRRIADMWLLSEYAPVRVVGAIHKTLDPEALRSLVEEHSGEQLQDQ